MSKVKEYLWREPEHDIELYYEQEPVMHISKMVSSRFIKSNDVEQPVLVTINGVKKTNVAKENEPPEEKYLLTFSDFNKPLVLNVTNINLCAVACKSENTDDWIGRQIVLENDPTVMYGGRLTGGVRIRAQKKIMTTEKPLTESSNQFDEDIGF